MEKNRDHKIYKYTNKVNGKVYIGKTRTSLQRRAGRNGERYSQCTYFGNAIKKYGWDNFEPTILEDNLTPEEATIKEVEYIKEYDSANPDKGYNLVDTVQSDFSEKTIIKLSERNKGKNNPMWGRHISERQKEIIRECNRNRVYTDEMRANASKAHKGKNCGKNHYLFGKHLSQEAKDKISKATKGRIPWNKGLKMSTVEGYVPSMLGKHLSNEAKKKLSIANKGRPNLACRKAVICLETGIVYESITQASKELNCDASEIAKCCKGKRRAVKGFHWNYVDD